MSIAKRQVLNYLEYCKVFEVAPNPLVEIPLHHPDLTTRIHLGKDFHKGELLPLEEILKDDSHFQTLDFRGATLGSTGCLCIQKILETNKTITKIDLSNNRIDHYGAEYLAKGLISNHTLKELNLRGNLLSRKGAYVLAEALKLNHTLTYLDVSNCFMGHEGVEAILRSASSHCEVNTTGNHVREEILNTLSHLLGIFLSFIGGYFLIEVARKHTWSYLIGCIIFALSLVLLFTASTLAHSFFWSAKFGPIFQLLDHTMISVLIAGSNTPFLLVSIGHTKLGVIFFFSIWVCCIGCIIFSFLGDQWSRVELMMFLLMGWLPVIGVKYVFSCIPLNGIILIGCEGFFYQIGVFFFIKGKKIPMYHALWHVCILIAAGCHYFAVLFYVDHVDMETNDLCYNLW